MDVRGKSSNGKRLIDVDEAIINFGFEWDDIPPTREEFVLFLKKQSIIDAVPVTRCRECKYHEEEGIEMVYCPNMIGGWVENEWFCANGKRKEGAE